MRDRITKNLFLILYYGFAQHLPISYTPIKGKTAKYCGSKCCHHILAECGKNVNKEKGASFSEGSMIEPGDNSVIGHNYTINPFVQIGWNVIMGPDVIIFTNRHAYDRLDLPIDLQGYNTPGAVTMEDGVWIGARVIILPGRPIGKSAVLGAGSVETKDVADYAVIGGNPAKILK